MKAKIKHFLTVLLPAWIYFFLAFEALAFSRALMLEEYGVHPHTVVKAAVGALLVAKVLIIVGLLPFMRPFPRTPIIYNVLWKTLVYTAAAISLQLGERAIDLLWAHKPLRDLLCVMADPGFWSIQIWLVLVLLVFVTFRELALVLGPERTREIFLKGRSSIGKSE